MSHRLSLLDRIRAQVLLRTLGAHPAVVSRLAGRPVTVDGLTLTPQTQLLLRLKQLVREPGPETMPIPQGRRTMLRQATMAGGRQPIGRVEERTVRGAEGPLPARLYVPTTFAGGADEPLLMFFHGGGMIYGDLDSHDAACRFLAERSGVRVLAVDYRLAPEHPFPAGVDDAWAAYSWVFGNAAQYGADPTRLAVGGDSAGGYLAAATAIRAAEEGVPLAFQLLIYPMTDIGGQTESKRLFGRGYYLTTEFMDLATTSYLGDADPRDPRVSVLHATVPPTLAPAFLSTAGFDPLRDEGEAYAEKLRAAGVPVEARRYAGEIHGYANVLGVEGPSKQAMAEGADALARALTGSPAAVDQVR